MIEKKESMVIPSYLHKYFWDVGVESFNKRGRATFTIERILEYGDRRAINWLTNNFDLKVIKEVISKSRRLSPKSANYWALILGIGKEKVKCLQRSYLKTQKRFWPY